MDGQQDDGEWGFGLLIGQSVETSIVSYHPHGLTCRRFYSPQFFYGDSVLRELCGMFCREAHLDRVRIQLDPNEINDKTTANVCTEPVYNMTVITGFQYGMVNYSQPRAQGVISGEWPPAPWGFEDIIPQIKQLHDRLVETNGTRFKPDIIVVRRLSFVPYSSVETLTPISLARGTIV